MEDRNILVSTVKENKFYRDFICYLKYLENQPIKLTASGNISMSNISTLLDSFCQREVFEEHAKHGWKIHHEYEVEFLEQIEVITKIMHLTFIRKGYIKLSRYGRDFLANLDPLIQHLNLVLFYWGQVNWDYFCHSSEIKGVTVISVLQKNQRIIWEVLSRQVNQWIDFDSFCQGLSNIFDLKKYYQTGYRDNFSYHLDIEYGLFRKNLVKFGVVEIEEVKDDTHFFKKITRFRVTPLGELLFLKSFETQI